MKHLSLPILSTMETTVVLTLPMLTLGCRLAEDMMTLKLSVPSFSLSLVIDIVNTTLVSPAGIVILYGPR